MKQVFISKNIPLSTTMSFQIKANEQYFTVVLFIML